MTTPDTTPVDPPSPAPVDATAAASPPPPPELSTAPPDGPLAPEATDAAPATTAPRIPDLPPAEVAKRLAELFPALFAPGVALPIKLRIQADIQERAPGIFSRKSLSIHLHRHTTSTPYLKALIAATQRVDLDGQPAGELAAEHKAAAQEELDRRRGLVQLRRQQERQLLKQHRRDSPATGLAPKGASQTEGTGATGVAGADAGAADQPALRPPRGPRPPGRSPGGRPQRPPRSPGQLGTDARPDGPPDSRAEGRSQQRHERGPGGRPEGARRHEGRGNAAHVGSIDRGPRGSANRADHRDAQQAASGPKQPPRHRPPHSPDSAGAAHRFDGPGATPRAPDTPETAERRARAQLLYAFESSPLSKANFCALKGLREAEFDAQIEQARNERGPGGKR